MKKSVRICVIRAIGVHPIQLFNYSVIQLFKKLYLPDFDTFISVFFKCTVYQYNTKYRTPIWVSLH